MAPLTADEFCSNEYDFLIVGGGTAGLVLSSRLSEIPGITVGVIEAGGDNSDMDEVKIPGMAGKGLKNERLDWNFPTIPQVGANDRVINCPRGKGMGGSSALNFMVYSRACAAEYDAIEALGNPGWNWTSFLHYMKKAETFSGPPVDLKDRYHIGTNADSHGFNGPLKISHSHWYNELHLPFMEAMVNLGVPINKNPTNGNNTGVYTGMFTIYPSLSSRSYSGNAYYQPCADRENVRLLSNAYATRVVLDLVDDQYVAKGVDLVKDARKYTAHAKREIILCCGSLQSPSILELSGIGLSKVLNAYGIPQLVDLPVGENLRSEVFLTFSQDHGWVPFVHKVDKNIETYENLADPDFFKEQQRLYIEERRGMFSGTFSAYTYIPLDQFMNMDILKKFLHDVKTDTSLTTTEALKQQFDLLKKWFSDTNHPQLEVLQLPGFHSLGSPDRNDDPSCKYQTLLLIDLHPLSRGSVHISTSDPTAKPTLDPGYFRNPRDVDVLVNGVRFAKKLMKTAPYCDAKPTFYDPTEDVVDDDEKLCDWVRDHVEPIYHPVGTCSMLPRECGGVVDSSLVVYGTKNLRVVDASILPMEMATHIQSSVYALAEKAADIIKEKHGL